MNENARRALQIETEFLAGAESNLEHAQGRQLRGSTWQTSRQDDEAALRDLLALHHRHSRTLLEQLPHNRRITLHGFERRWWFGKRKTSVAVASLLAPLEHLAAGAEGTLPPLDLGDLVDHVRALVSDPEVPHLIGVCSPSGFTDEARNSQLELPNVTLVLIEPREADGWRVTGVSDDISEQVLALFNPMATSQKLDRVRREIERRRADLLVSGLNADALAARLDLPEAAVVAAFEQAAFGDPELKVTRQTGEVLLVRGAAPASQVSSSVIDRIRALFDRAGDATEKIGLLAEQRAGLAQRRDRLQEDSTILEEKEAELLQQGRRASSDSARRRTAGELAHLRKSIARQNTLARLLYSQIEIISTHIHNLTLIQQGRLTKLPDTEEITRNAVQAEEMITSLQADADLAARLEAGLSADVTSAEELAILKEFERATETERPVSTTESETPPVEERDAAAQEDKRKQRPAADSEA
ncbi:MAG: hypothetical protein KAY37_01625 [Phycisphaerae bacterium]|nr:hypothetical protein [Phycisphaerae bacterium]